ncbi:efflux RND transporter periplasmic adaptor subunit [Nitratireductor luteus]|uniref:efflux RND transporter periplasmic adaptor subunit n=1 Tax=Nitratireductor luteus TaxID=2976980 RepID=UPI00223EC4A8|nr:efflux RND transporter periplasmic adaptor subunit [Nitratireductor luteus]
MSKFIRFGALALTALALAACSESEANNEKPAPVPTVSIKAVSDTPSLDTRNFVGRLAPVSTVEMSFRVGGELVEMPVMEGTKVEKGALLAALDPVDYELAYRQAKLSEELARADFERKEKLLASRSVSNAVFDQSKTEYELRKVAAENAQRDLQHTRLEAPFDALITRRLTDTYTNVAAGAPVLRIQDISELRVKISVPEDLVRLVGQPGAMQVEASIPGIDRRFPLEYREHNTEANDVAQTYEVTFGMKPPEGLNLLPGMTASVAIRYAGPMGDKVADKMGVKPLSVPLSAVDTSVDGSFQVWVFDASTKQVSPRKVTLGSLEGERVPILSGLDGNEMIVAAGGPKLQDGMTVRSMNAF